MNRVMKGRLFNIFRYVMLLFWSLIVAFPVFWIVSTSFKPDWEWHAWPPVYWSQEASWANYQAVWGRPESPRSAADVKTQTARYESASANKPWQALWNSLYIAITATALSVAFGAILAYGVSRYRILSEIRMFQLLVLRMIPPIVVAAPLTLYYSALHLMDTATGLVIVYFITTLPYSVWMTKSFVDEVPVELETGRGDSGREQMAGDPRSHIPAHSLRVSGDVPVHPHPDVERISALSHALQGGRGDAARHSWRNTKAPTRAASTAIRPLWRWGSHCRS